MRLCILVILATIQLNLASPVHQKQSMDDYIQSKYKAWYHDVKLEFLLNQEFSPYYLKELLKELGAPDVNIAYIQSRIETANYKSKLFKQNNLFGLHYARKRETNAIGWRIADGGARCAIYNKWQDSVIDYVNLINYWKSFGYKTTNFKEFLVNVGYCELGGGYIKLIEKIERYERKRNKQPM